MLQIKNISKEYKTGDLVQTALDGVSLNFRDNEFVSILGPSGSGKTTLLNIVGGLDRYDSGDLIINNVSTKNYKDRDWDSYRNHTIGFVFQSYNLIPHQTVLANVELALTIGGISKQERKKRALDALDKVGLKEQAHKKPNQMSGGQMQRVAIARALVNDPDILLADEPTGALDTGTSVQVMELLKEVAKDRLVIMVTHNPELAEEYSTRIVKLKDGKIIDDSDPFVLDAEGIVPPEHKNLGKASMSFATALSLSLNNLMTKKARTILTAFAGSIGIIGIALILSLSTGFQNYIDQIQEETLTSYPLSVYSETADMTSALLSMVSEGTAGEGTDVVKEKQYLTSMFSSIGTNDLESLKKHLEENEKKVDELTTLVRYQYSVKPMIYTRDSKKEPVKLNPSEILEAMSGGSTSAMMMSSASGSVFNEMIDDQETIEKQYDVLAGRWPQNYDEAIIVLSEPNGITDLLVYGLGLRDNEEFREMLTDLMAGEKVEKKDKPLEMTYDDLLNIELKVVDATATYKYNSQYDIYEDMSDDEAYMQKVYDEAMPLEIVGIVCLKEGESSMSLSPGVCYTKELTSYVMEKAAESEIVAKQKENRDINVFSGKRFDDENEKSGLDFQDMITIDEGMLSEAFGVKISEDDIANMTEGRMNAISKELTADVTPAKNAFESTLVTMMNDMLSQYIEKNYNDTTQCAVISMEDVEPTVAAYMKTDNCKKLLLQLEKEYLIPQETFSIMYAEIMKGVLQGYIGISDGILNLLEKDEAESKESDMPASVSLVDEKVTDDFAEVTKEEAADVPDETEEPNVSDESEGTDVSDESEKADVPDESEETDVSDESGKEEVPEAPEISDENVDATLENIRNFIDGMEIPDVNDLGNAKVDPDARGILTNELVAELLPYLLKMDAVQVASNEISTLMTETVMQKEVLTEVGGLTGDLMGSMAKAFNVQPEKIAGAFQFNMDEEELKRLMETMTTSGMEKNADTNLLLLGYQEKEKPSSISFYFVDFDAKETFVDFLDSYNEDMEKVDEDKVIQYTDLTGLLMSSVSTIVDSVTYVLIAFVSISLIVSSIMIGIITYISVLERTKEIGVLRAIGASKKNISSIFNAETFIVGFFSGLLGVGVTAALVPPINYIIHTLTNNYDINAVLPVRAAIVLVVLSIILTLISGLIPSRQAAKKDPVLALRSE